MSKPLASGQDSPLNNNKKMKNLNFQIFTQLFLLLKRRNKTA